MPDLVSKLHAATYAALDPPILTEGTQVIRSEGWYQLVNPTLKEASANEVMLSTSRDSELDHRIEQAFDIYRKHQLPFKWAIGPMSSPQVEAKISAHASTSWEFSGMAIDAKSGWPKMTHEVFAERVGQHNFSEFLEVNRVGWDLGPFLEQTRLRLQQMVAHPRYRCFIARKDGQAIASATTLLKEGYGYLVGAVVLKEFRGCGAYRVLIQARLNDLCDLSVPYAVTQARNATSAPILTQLGFETLYSAKIYRFDPGTE